MTLTNKILLCNAALSACLLVLIGVSLWGINGLRGELDQAFEEAEELRLATRIDVEIMAASALLSTDDPDLDSTQHHIDVARALLRAFLDEQHGHEHAPGDHGEREDTLAQAALADLDGAALAHGDRSINDVQVRLQSAAAALRALEELTLRVSHDAQQAAEPRQSMTIVILTAVSIAFAVVVLVITLLLHRGVIRPLRRLRAGVERIAAGRFDERLRFVHDPELSRLADAFNRMAGELDALYANLEDQVATKTRELVRSERLASVGYLAAGVAHEINNPLGIISGHAELSLQRLERDARGDEESVKSMAIIRDEAFRCKDIIGKLLTLSKMGDGSRTTVSLGRVTEDVTALLRGLKGYRDRAVQVELGKGERLLVYGNENELKQVILNLASNALEATDASDGEVRITCHREDGHVRLEVVDNGRGISPESLGRVFEPFFSERTGDSRQGIGLGLSISNAVIESHGGTIRVTSNGPGTGSRFTVDLPAMQTNGSRDAGA